jgi:hypothetical protein
VIKQHLETQTKEVQILDDVVCNKCGCSCHVEGEDDQFNFVELKWVGTYFTSDDFDKRPHLCVRCFGELVATFVIPFDAERDHFVEGVKAFRTKLRQNPKAWKEHQRWRAAWDAIAGEGLEQWDESE